MTPPTPTPTCGYDGIVEYNGNYYVSDVPIPNCAPQIKSVYISDDI